MEVTFLEKSSSLLVGQFGRLEMGSFFHNKVASLMEWRAALKEDLGLVCIKAKKSIADPVSMWRESNL
jgi:hypothetical protein